MGAKTAVLDNTGLVVHKRRVQLSNRVWSI